jgi:hypothetical protein
MLHTRVAPVVDAVAAQPPVSVPNVMVTPADGVKYALSAVMLATSYRLLSAKKASCADDRLRRSALSVDSMARDFVLPNFGIAIDARMPIITTTIKSSMRVKPRRVVDIRVLLRKVDDRGG